MTALMPATVPAEQPGGPQHTGNAAPGKPAPLGGPAPTAWQEHMLVRIKEVEALRRCLVDRNAADPPEGYTDAACAAILAAIDSHLVAARDAAEGKRPTGSWPGSTLWRRWLVKIHGADIERALYNVTAAEANLLRIAPMSHISTVMPSLLAHVRQHLASDDPRRVLMEDLAQDARKAVLDESRREFVIAAVRAADLEKRGEVMRVRSFRNVLLVSTVLLVMIAVALAVFAGLRPTALPLCFAPQEPGKAQLVCPTGGTVIEGVAADALPTVDQLNDAERRTVNSWDVPLVQTMGAVAAAVAAAVAIRNARGTSTPYSLPVALGLLKLPLGALTAILGLVLMRAQFVPGLSALDTSAQIVGWAVVFGYAQQLFTRFVDQRAHAVLDDVGSNSLNRTPGK